MNTSPVAGTSYVVTGLSGGTTYYFKVKAINTVGTSPSSNEASATTPVLAPSPPSGLTATAGNGQVSLTWTAPASDGGSPVADYLVYNGNPGAQKATQYQCTFATRTSTSCAVTGLTNGTSYNFVVLARNSGGYFSRVSNEVSATPGVPGAPTGLTATAGNAQATVVFTAPASDGGSAITGYAVTAHDSSTPANGGQTASGLGSPITVTGLTNGDSYTFTVVATNRVGSSSSSSAATTSVTPATVPGAPTIGTATAGNGQATVTFTTPASDGGAAITDYTVTSNPGGKTTPGSASPITVAGLTNGTAYTFTVMATNRVGSSPSSTATTSVTPATVPGAPTIGTATAGNGQDGHLHRPGRRRGRCHHRLHGDLEPGGEDHPRLGQSDHRGRVDEWDGVHVRGDRHQQGGGRSGVGVGHPPSGASEHNHDRGN